MRGENCLGHGKCLIKCGNVDIVVSVPGFGLAHRVVVETVQM